MRRYGHSWRSDDPLVVIDSEVQIGFSDRDRCDADNAETRKQLQLSCSESIPRKLDALGVFPTGNLGLVEVKDTKGSIDRALVQAAVHLVRFSRLMARGLLRDTVQAMVDQKTATGVIPPRCPRPGDAPRIVPCIAAPDTSSDWPASWNQAIYECRREVRTLLTDLLFVRLDRYGQILEMRRR